MRTYSGNFMKAVFFSLCVIAASGGWAQTAGTFTFKINPVAHSGSYGTKYLVAIWVENSAGTFVKTKLKQASTSNYDHLATWTSKSNKSLVDATSGATLSTYSPITVTWNGTDVSGTVVADGSYKVWIEMAWDRDLTTGKTVTSFDFTKGATAFQSAPVNTSLFTDISLNWAPVVTGIQPVAGNMAVQVYPNPTGKLVNVNFKSAAGDCTVRILNASGKTVSQRQIAKGTTGIQSFDLENFADGIYVVDISESGKNTGQQFKVLLKK